MNGDEPLIEPRAYSLEAVIEITGVDREMIFQYCESGLLPMAPDEVEEGRFDDELIQLFATRNACGSSMA